MSGINEEHPWLPADPGEEFDPLAHAGVRPDKETPIVVTPRGGAREVGRSCYQVDTEHGTYLVDCGLNQGGGEDFPDFRGLDPGQIDAVFLTHAHIDHSGALPVLEARGLLDDDAVILATEPTIDLATMLLNDSLKIHRRETQQQGESQQFTQRDVDAVLDRFESIGYGGGRVAGVADVPDMEPLVFQFGNAAHLLGSAWVALQSNGYRVVFSGDIGGRASHLPDITPAPTADLLLLESTYGGTHSHTSMSDSQTSLYSIVERAIEAHEPVLIPTFAVGRAQLIQLLFKNRLHSLPGDLQNQVRVVIDGMAQEATETYHQYVRDEDYVDESLVNAAVESGRDQPFLPDGAVFPENDADRRDVLEDADPSSGGKVPVVLAPSGMLTGGNSPRYLAEFAARFGSANIILTGYQAVGTTGRQLQNQIKAGDDELHIETDATPFGTDWPSSEDVVWTAVTDDDGNRNRVSRATMPAGWIHQMGGLSGHASQQGLREFCRSVEPRTVALVHGPDHAQDHLAKDLTQNVAEVEQTTRSRLLTPIPVTRDIELDTPTLSESNFDSSEETYGDQLEHLHEVVSTLSEDIAAVRGERLTEAEVRQIVREELENVAGIDETE